MKSFNVLIVTDKKMGHENISMGIAKYISKEIDVNIKKVEAKLRVKILSKIATFIVNNFNLKNIEFLVKLFYKNITIPKGKFNLIISTGGDTSFLNICLSKLFNIPNIYCSSLRGINPNLFTYIVSIVDHNIPNEIVVDLAPLYVEIEPKTLDGKYIAILIGGPTKIYQFKDEEFIEIVKNIINLANKMGYKILLTTSRRTPILVEEKLGKLSKNDLIKEAVLYNKNPKKVINFFLSNADIVFCTEDSSNMITEAILSKKKVYTIKSKKIKFNELFYNFIQKLEQKKFIHSIEIDKIDKITFDEKFNLIEKSPGEIVVEKIKKLWENK